MYCNKCGNKISEKEKYCSKCGQELKYKESTNQNISRENKNEGTSLVLGIVCLMSSFFLNILSFIPGIISIVYANKYKKESGKLGTGFILSIIGMIIGFLMMLLILVIIFFALFAISSTNIVDKFKNEIKNEIQEPVVNKISDFEDLNDYTVGTKFEYEDNEWTIMYDNGDNVTAISNNIISTTKEYFKVTEEDINYEINEFINKIDNDELVLIDNKKARLLDMNDINNLCTNTYNEKFDRYTLNNCPSWLRTNKKTLTSIPKQHENFAITADSTIQNYYYLSNEFEDLIELSSIIQLDSNLFNFRPIITITK